jgi:hypothetical protein
MRSLADASPAPSRAQTHGLGPMWIATPSSHRTCTDYSLPISRRTIPSAPPGSPRKSTGDCARHPYSGAPLLWDGADHFCTSRDGGGRDHRYRAAIARPDEDCTICRQPCHTIRAIFQDALQSPREPPTRTPLTSECPLPQPPLGLRSPNGRLSADPPRPGTFHQQRRHKG